MGAGSPASEPLPRALQDQPGAVRRSLARLGQVTPKYPLWISAREQVGNDVGHDMETDKASKLRMGLLDDGLDAGPARRRSGLWL